MYNSGDLGCRNALFVMGAIMFYMKALSLDRQMKLFRNMMGNAQIAAESFRCYL
jgi:hypothetical protein